MAGIQFTALVLLALTGCSQAIMMGSAEVSKLGTHRECPTRPWTAKQSRIRERFIPVVFEKPFSAPPLVAVTVTGMDVKHDTRFKTTIRLKVEAQDITAEGFTLYIGTWCWTKVYWAQAQWFAVADESAPVMGEVSLV